MANHVYDVLNKHLFYPMKERLHALVEVKSQKKRIPNYLALTVSLRRPVIISLHLVKPRSDIVEAMLLSGNCSDPSWLSVAGTPGSWKRKATWNVRDIGEVDGREMSDRVPVYDLDIRPSVGKVQHFVTTSVHNKYDFIGKLWHVVRQYLPHHALPIVNVPSTLISDSPVALTRERGESDLTGTGGQAVPTSGGQDENEYRALSAREERDLKLLLDDSENTVTNAVEFMENLRESLMQLEGTNIHSIMSSEEQVAELMRFLDKAAKDVEHLDSKLSLFDKTLASVEEAMELLSNKDRILQLMQVNQDSLTAELATLLESLELSAENTQVLVSGDLTSPNAIAASTEACQILEERLAEPVPNGLEHLTAVVERKAEWSRLRTTFLQRLSKHMNSLFIHTSNNMIEGASRGRRDNFQSQHFNQHRELIPYAQLMLWLKQTQSDVFEKLEKLYCEKMARVYENELNDYFDSAKNTVFQLKEKKGSGGDLKQSLSSSSLHTKNQDTKASKGPTQANVNEDLSFDKVFDNVFSILEPVCQEEQSFCIAFFHISTDSFTTGDMDFLSDSSIDLSMGDQRISVHSGISADISADSTSIGGEPKRVSQEVSAEVVRIMSAIFPSLSERVRDFVSICVNVDPAHSMSMLVILHDHLQKMQKSRAFLTKIWAAALVVVKRAFDDYVRQIDQSFLEAKINKKSKCGILPMVKTYAEFAHQSSLVFKTSSRTTELEKAHRKLLHSLMELITKHSPVVDHLRTPHEVIVMENCHRLHSILSSLRMSQLEDYRRMVRQASHNAQDEYVISCLGRPLEKLNNFFEAVERSLESGVKLEAISYQTHFSRQELRKVIKEYPGKEVKKGLEQLWRKVEKHLCEEENLFQVVWRSMQNEFLKQYKSFEDLIAKCYPDSAISLEFTIDDILKYFTDIAQSHS